MRSAISLVLMLGVHATVWAQAAESADAPTTLAPGIVVDAKRREVRMDATVCLRRGILEFIVCRTRTFEHESVFATDCRASGLHTALLLIGGDPFPFIVDEEWSLKAREHKPSRLKVDVEFELDGAPQRRPISDFLLNRERKDGIVADAWIFTGSVFYTDEGKEHYAADSSGAIIGVTPKGASVIQYGEKSGVPYQGENQGMEINDSVAPPVGTKVRLVFSLHDREGHPANDGHAKTGVNP